MIDNPSILLIFTGAGPRSVNVKKWLDLFANSEAQISIMFRNITQQEKQNLKKHYPYLNFIFFKTINELKNLSLIKRYQYIREVSCTIDQLKVDVIHLHGAFYNYMVYPLFFLKTRPVLIYNVWGSDFNLKFKKKLKNTFILKALIKKSDLVLTNWFQLALEIKEHFPRFKEKIKTIPWGVSDELFNPPKQEYIRTLKSKFGIADNEYVLLYTRGLVQNSNHDKLLKSISLIPENLKFKLIIHNTNSKSVIAQNLKKYVQKKGLDRKVIFSEHYLSDSQMQALYHMADLVFSLTTKEQFSQVIVEAILADCHLILHKNPAYHFLKEVFRFNIELVDVFKPAQLAQRIEYFIQNRFLPQYQYEKMVIDRLFRFSAKRNEFLKLYRDLTAEKMGKEN
ncbi:glycosyltransferase family 4 protein [Calditrichota bacterium GD2]